MAQEIRPTYNDPAYLIRLSQSLGAITAGAAGVTTKHVTFANWQLYDVTLAMTVLGTSTNTVNGTATLSGQLINIITIVNANAFTTNTVSLTTNTYGPFAAGGYAGTAQLSAVTQYALNTASSTTGWGGIPLPAGSILYAVSGTDATAVSLINIGYQISPAAPLTV